MNRFLLAFSCFFRLLGEKLRPEVAGWLPDGAKALPAATPTKVVAKKELIVESMVDRAPEKAAPEKAAAPEKPRKSDAVAQREGALALLGLLQREGRLVDFLQRGHRRLRRRRRSARRCATSTAAARRCSTEHFRSSRCCRGARTRR